MRGCRACPACLQHFLEEVLRMRVPTFCRTSVPLCGQCCILGAAKSVVVAFTEVAARFSVPQRSRSVQPLHALDLVGLCPCHERATAHTQLVTIVLLAGRLERAGFPSVLRDVTESRVYEAIKNGRKRQIGRALPHPLRVSRRHKSPSAEHNLQQTLRAVLGRPQRHEQVSPESREGFEKECETKHHTPKPYLYPSTAVSRKFGEAQRERPPRPRFIGAPRDIGGYETDKAAIGEAGSLSQAAVRHNQHLLLVPTAN
jgi:hypothetical protein